MQRWRGGGGEVNLKNGSEAVARPLVSAACAKNRSIYMDMFLVSIRQSGAVKRRISKEYDPRVCLSVLRDVMNVVGSAACVPAMKYSLDVKCQWACPADERGVSIALDSVAMNILLPSSAGLGGFQGDRESHAHMRHRQFSTRGWARKGRHCTICLSPGLVSFSIIVWFGLPRVIVGEKNGYMEGIHYLFYLRPCINNRWCRFIRVSH